MEVGNIWGLKRAGVLDRTQGRIPEGGVGFWEPFMAGHYSHLHRKDGGKLRLRDHRVGSQDLMSPSLCSSLGELDSIYSHQIF